MNRLAASALASVVVVFPDFAEAAFQPFGEATTKRAVANAVSLGSGDFTGDGILDIVVLQSDVRGRVFLFANDGAANFTGTPLTEEFTSPPERILPFDTDGDGDLDMVPLGSNSGDPSRALRNDGGGTFTFIDLGVTRLRDLAAMDIDTNGTAEVVGLLDTRQTPGGQTLPSVLFTAPAGTNLVGATLTESANDVPDVYRLAVGKFDSDADFDVATIPNILEGNLNLFLNDGTWAFSQAAGPTLGINPAQITASDLDGDGLSDLVIYIGSPEFSIYINSSTTGTPQFAPAVNYATVTGAAKPLAIDLDGDADPDIVASGRADGRVAVHENNGDGTFQPALFLNTGFLASDFAVADFNGDQVPDLISVERLPAQFTFRPGIAPATPSLPSGWIFR